MCRYFSAKTPRRKEKSFDANFQNKSRGAENAESRRE
jgi:hypothetical protein